MDQLNLPGLTESNKPAGPDLDPAKYEGDRGECEHPHLTLPTAYRYGCRCLGCTRYHAAENKLRGKFPRPCMFPGCDKPKRRVQAARYCEEHATMIAGQFKQSTSTMAESPCLACGFVGLHYKNTTYKLCQRCTNANFALTQSARRHHVPPETLARWLTHPHCELCSVRVTTTRRTANEAAFNIDHDHRCCPNGDSCGRCIRGLLCARCNVRLGAFESLAGEGLLSTLGEYLKPRQADG